MNKKIIVILSIILIAGALTYIFSYGEWEFMDGTEGSIDNTWYYDEDDPVTQFEGGSISFDDFGYDKWKLTTTNELSKGSYEMMLVEVDDIHSDISSLYANQELDIVYQFPKMEVGTEGCELLFEDGDEIEQRANYMVQVYLEETVGASSGWTLYGKRRHIMEIIEFFKDLGDDEEVILYEN